MLFPGRQQLIGASSGIGLSKMVCVVVRLFCRCCCSCCCGVHFVILVKYFLRVAVLATPGGKAIIILFSIWLVKRN